MKRRDMVIAAVFAVELVVLGYAWGQHSQFTVASEAYDAAESAAQALGVCAATLNRTMSVVLREDAYLHQQLRELPPFVWVAP